MPRVLKRYKGTRPPPRDQYAALLPVCERVLAPEPSGYLDRPRQSRLLDRDGGAGSSEE